MKHRRVGVLLVCVMSLGCQDASAPEAVVGTLPIQTDRRDYRPGDVVLVTTINQFERVIYDSHCAGEVQGLEYLGRWNGSYGMHRSCHWPDPAEWRAYSVAIPPGATHIDTMVINSRAYTGTWRVELDLRTDAGERLPLDERVSNSFQVRGTWVP